MKKLFALAGASILVATAACATQAGESVDTGESALFLPFPIITLVSLTSLSATATDSTVAVGYVHSNSTSALTVTLTGPTGTYSLPETAQVVSLSGSSSYRTTFTGLADCATFTWAVVSGSSSYASGTIHTRAPGNAACPAGESLAPSSALQFRGVGHEYDGTNGLSFGSFPWGSGWTLTSPAASMPITVGWQHYDGPNEWYDDARRARLVWNLDATQQRRATDAQIVSPYEMDLGPSTCPSLNIIESSVLFNATWPLTTTQTDNLSPWGNQTWAQALGGPEISTGLQPQSTGGRSIVFSGGNASVDVPLSATGTIIAGFIGVGDGFPAQVNPPPASSYPQENSACMVDLTAPKLQLTYQALPPETPLGCSVAMVCGSATISCNASGDVFVVHQVTPAGDVVAATVDMTSSPTTPFTATVAQSGTASYYVCTVSGGSSACTSTLSATGNAGCCTASETCTYDDSPPLMTLSCPNATSFYQDNSGVMSSPTTGTSYTFSTEPSTTAFSIIACPSGVSPGGVGCQSFSEYMPKSSWCGGPPPPTTCGTLPTRPCAGTWHCCGTWTCGVCQ
jgi:hypothetical protein